MLLMHVMHGNRLPIHPEIQGPFPHFVLQEVKQRSKLIVWRVELDTPLNTFTTDLLHDVERFSS